MTSRPREPLGRSGRALLLIAATMAGLATARANDPEGHGPDSWRVTGVAAGHVLNARMGPGTDYAVIARFQPDEGGLTQTTCVPFLPTRVWMDMSKAQRQALPQRWCLMRSADLQRAGWVAQRHITEDTGPAVPPPATAAAPDDASECRSMLTTLSEKLPPVLQEAADAFTLASGFSKAPETAADGSDYYDKARFPRAGESALLPDSNLAAVTRALLAFDHAEGVLPHARYRVSYHLEQHSDGCNNTPRAYVEVTRFNLGLARYEDTIQYVDQEFWPPKDHFAAGRPHVSRRYVMGPVQGMQADVKQQSRRVVADHDADRADCLGQPCLALEDAQGPGGLWKNMAAAPDAEATSPVYNEPGYSWAPGPARVAESLYAQATGSSGDIEASSFARPDITLVISRDVEGQDSNTRGLLRWQGLMDDAMAEIWLRLRAQPGSKPQLQQHIVHHRGRS